MAYQAGHCQRHVTAQYPPFNGFCSQRRADEAVVDARSLLTPIFVRYC